MANVGNFVSLTVAEPEVREVEGVEAEVEETVETETVDA